MVDGRLEIEVSNTGRLKPAGTGDGLGLHNAREQLRLVYGDAASLALTERGADTVVASVQIPRRPGATHERPAR